ncbi:MULTISPECIES: IclR family transcriptional regulator [unclassified Rhizobium]|uniref:IclR family transcriptional regulator n=1 Tax=unclassified Rhizobium TaxID=2613769 RepID=UPI002479D793|nr:MULTISPECIES: IclR family transcriptional regulator [unclassified Rhizobium]MDH7803645.1 DNA-binding IclR family transcriptional regulator [Rhizobium sp. AN70]
MTKTKQTSSTGAQLLDRAVILLDLVADGGVDGITLKELTERSGLNTATCHRILNTLVGHKLLARDDKKRCYRLGGRMAIYGARAARGPGIINRCEAALTRIRRRTGDTIHLMVRQNHDSVCLDRRDGECVVPTLTGSIGGAVALGVGPGSIAMLAFLDEDEQDFIIRANAARYASYRDLTEEKVRKLIADTRERGYAVDVGELIPGIAGVAVPIFTDGNKASASLGFTLLCAKLVPGSLEQYALMLKEEISMIASQ